ncbi:MULTISPECIES: DUF1992 domain-containing protein [Metabacillus]|uniref:DUF1992 domain-containing protein n=1 Tax=Metabacillus hrfriensis TaxID=3048891 RepID=A0ACD4RD32_9BACI|nr:MULTISPECIES: DUF1992 domain-containing protein [Metabacillus]UAL52849.1 DUF1992 domain-containing protein [Metabacillus dongyingensis]UOK58477.1 DUF1992 domain-containing protein [Bacillus sp. OVS6]USK29171.1 DUF1992 domain-containing protein [Bacillus sp. CMF21]WHZ58391.1 DUF1992 domain-containing protein [Metabacillus sp. CT-WN-B3]
MDFFTILSEDKIKQAIKDGEFKQLPGMGKPLELEDLSHIPPELRISYKILKNANMMDEDIELKKAIHTLEQLIAQCPDEMEKEKLQVQLNEKAFQLDKVLKKRNTFSSRASAFYKDQIFSKWS